MRIHGNNAPRYGNAREKTTTNDQQNDCISWYVLRTRSGCWVKYYSLLFYWYQGANTWLIGPWLYQSHTKLTSDLLVFSPSPNFWVLIPVVLIWLSPFFTYCAVIQYRTSRSGLIENVWRSHWRKLKMGSPGFNLCSMEIYNW